MVQIFSSTHDLDASLLRRDGLRVEHDLMTKKRSPFNRGILISFTAANQFVAARAVFDEFGLTESYDARGASAATNYVFQFHALSLAGEVGQSLSMLKNISNSFSRPVPASPLNSAHDHL